MTMDSILHYCSNSSSSSNVLCIARCITQYKIKKNQEITEQIEEEITISEQVDHEVNCKYKQTGLSKFCENYPKVHNNEVCNNKSDCRSLTCTKRHPKVCKIFKDHGYCRHKEPFFYQDMLLQIHAKHVEETNNLREE